MNHLGMQLRAGKVRDSYRDQSPVSRARPASHSRRCSLAVDVAAVAVTVVSKASPVPPSQVMEMVAQN